MIENPDLQMALQHLERLTTDQAPLYPHELPLFKEFARDGKLESDSPIGRRRMLGGQIGGLCTRVITLDLLNEETQKVSIGTEVDGLIGLVSVGVLYKPLEAVKSTDIPFLGAIFALTTADEPQLHTNLSGGMLHPTLARYGGSELMQWGIRPHFRETPVRFTARANVVKYINYQLAALT